MRTLSFDAVVVGAGSAGAGAAWQLARTGLRVALVEQRPATIAGASWVDAIPPWMFDEAGVPRPAPPELRGSGGRFVVFGRDPRNRLDLPRYPFWTVDMRAFVARLQRLAREAGVTLLERTAVTGVERDGGRLRRLQLRGPDRADRATVEAALFVDASGLGGALRTRVPALQRLCPPPRPGQTCLAAHRVCEVRDRDGAAAFLERHGAVPGSSLSWIGVGRGFSTRTVTLPHELDEVELLSGVLADDDGPSAAKRLDQLTREQRWIGRRRFAGGGPIPVRRPYDRLAVPGLALIGDAACQVFPAHGSGVGVHLIAGKLLAAAVAYETDPGGLDATWRYQATFQRRWGALLGAYDVFRALAGSLDGAEVDAMLHGGLISPTSSIAAMEQRMLPPDPSVALGALRGALRAPRRAGRMAPVVLRMQLVHAAYRRYPTRPDEAALRRWSHRTARRVGDLPDIP